VPGKSKHSNRKTSDRGVLDEAIIPGDVETATLEINSRRLRVTNLSKIFWPDEGLTKRDLLNYYATISPVLLPHLANRAMVMKRFPNGITGKHFFMKRTPSHRPDWLTTCTIPHQSGHIDFPVVDDLAALLWIVNLGCIDLNQWYARCDDFERPDYLHFDLDPVENEKEKVPFSKVRQAAMVVRESLASLGIESCAKTTGSRGMHVYVAIERGPLQKDVWHFAKAFARLMERREPKLITSEYAVSKRPPGRVLVDYNQNAWARTLASAYSVRPRPRAPVSAPVTWKEVEKGVEIEDFRLDNMAGRVAKVGDLWAPMIAESGRLRLDEMMDKLTGEAA
jgi:bifunctional non-homologous end joining protein LigD